MVNGFVPAERSVLILTLKLQTIS